MLCNDRDNRPKKSFRLRFAILTSATALLWHSGYVQAAETKSYVVNWFHIASYFSGDADCPDGLNPTARQFYERDLMRVYKDEQKVADIMSTFPGEGIGMWIEHVSKRGNGKDDVYVYPETAPDPGLKEYKGKFALGFNLDGKMNPNSFEDPQTHEKGVDNQLHRTLGCIRSYRGGVPGTVTFRPAFPEIAWNVLRNVMPAWIITVTTEDNGDAVVTFNRALTKITRDASGETVRADMSYRIDTDPRGHNVVRGKIADGVFTISEPTDVNLVADTYGLAPDITLKRARLRLKFHPDGTLEGVVGGYQPWFDWYWSIAGSGFARESSQSTDAIAMYYALTRNADGDPDPKTGKNTTISSSYYFDAVPALILPPKETESSSSN